MLYKEWFCCVSALKKVSVPCKKDKNPSSSHLTEPKHTSKNRHAFKHNTLFLSLFQTHISLLKCLLTPFLPPESNTHLHVLLAPSEKFWVAAFTALSSSCSTSLLHGLLLYVWHQGSKPAFICRKKKALNCLFILQNDSAQKDTTHTHK